jgi:hypothetical protein
MKSIWKSATIGLAVVTAMAAPLAMSLPLAKADDKKDETTLVSIWDISKDGATVTAVVPGQKDPQPLLIKDDTLIAGICTHCILPIKFKAGDTAKKCIPCGCDVTNGACIVDKTLKPATAVNMFREAAYGTGLKVVYNEPGKPESGVKSVYVDRKTVYVTVDGLAAQTPEQLTSLVKPIGGTKPVLSEEGKRLTFSVKDWSPAVAAKFEQAVTKAGGKIVRPEKPAAAQ